MLALERYLPYLINRAGVRLAVNFAGDIAASGIGIQEWRVLAALAAVGEQRLSDLAALTSIDLSTLSRLVSRMARQRLVARVRSNGDRRERRIRLAAKGKRTTRAIMPIAVRYERVALAGIGAADARTLRRLLSRIYANLDALERK